MSAIAFSPAMYQVDVEAVFDHGLIAPSRIVNLGLGKINFGSISNLKASVLKAGHHGSKGSSSEAFLDQLQPSLALVSAGENNRYKHPNDETLERFKERHIKVLRTDQNGAIRFKGWFKWSSETVR